MRENSRRLLFHVALWQANLLSVNFSEISMRARYKGPSGTGVLQLPDDATIQDVLDEIRTKSGISRFVLKYGPPMAMKTINPSDYKLAAASIGLHGETLTVVPDEASPDMPPTSSATASNTPQSNPNRSQTPAAESSGRPEDINAPWPEREGTLCRCLS